eukprot:GHVL01015518.1.p1 GENE.GHVL01015518.1~~GHVL01015518.1.p1  ORF type:complete len:396 (+),score=51.52 GHVL01015518.1:36-1223(+)
MDVFKGIGQLVRLQTNFYRLETTNKDAKVLRYTLELTPPLPDDMPVRARDKCMELACMKLRIPRETIRIGLSIYSYEDGLKREPVNFESFGRKKGSSSLKLTAILKGPEQVSLDTDMQKTLVQNIIINAMLKSKSSGPGGGSYKKIKNMFSDTKERNVVALDGGKFIIIKGFTMTAKICVGGLFLEVDNSFKLIRTESALDVLRRITRGRPSVADVKQFLREVPTVYATWNQTTYTIIGIGIGGSEDEDTTLHSTFKRRWRRNTGKEILNEKTGKMVPEIITEEEEITFLDYFNKILFGKYSDPSCKVRDLSQPLLKGISKNATGMMKSKPCWLPPEAVKPIGMSEKSRTPQLMRQLIKTTNLAPSERFESLNEVVNDLNSGEDAKKFCLPGVCR